MNIKELLAKIKTDKKAFLIALSLLAGAVIVIAGAVIALVLLTGDGGQPDVSGGGSAAGSRPENASSNAYVSERFPSIDTSKIRIEGGTLYAIKGLKVGDLKTALDYQGTGEIQIKNTADVTMGDDDLLVTGMRLDVVEEGAVAVSYTIEVLESSDIGDASLPEQNGGSSPGGDGSSSKPQGGASGSETPENPTESQGDGNVNTQPTADKYLGGHSVRDYGAKGDGKTDDTEAINNAINHSMADGMPVYFPSGTYLVKRQIMMTNGVTFYGKRVSDIQKEADSLPTLLIDQTSGPGLVFTAGGAINGIQVKYNAGHASKEPAILCNAPGTRITNVVITNAYTGIEYEQSGNQNPGRGCIENVIINSPVSVGAFIRDTYDVTYVKNVTVNGSAAMQANGTAFRFAHNDAIRVSGLTANKANVGFLFDDQRVNGDTTGSTWGAFQDLRTQDVNIGIHITSISEEVRMNPLSIMNSTIQANKEALKVEHSRASASFSGVAFRSGTATGLHIDGGDALMFSECDISAGGATGVHILQTGNLTMSGCKIRASSVGIRLEKAAGRGIVITGNTVSAPSGIQNAAGDSPAIIVK